MSRKGFGVGKEGKEGLGLEVAKNVIGGDISLLEGLGAGLVLDEAASSSGSGM